MHIYIYIYIYNLITYIYIYHCVRTTHLAKEQRACLMPTICITSLHCAFMLFITWLPCVSSCVFVSRANMHSPNMWFQLIFSHCPIQSGKKCLESLCFVIFACSIRCGCVVVVLTDCLSLCLIWAPVEPGPKCVSCIFVWLCWHIWFRWASFEPPLSRVSNAFSFICVLTLLTYIVSLSLIWAPVEPGFKRVLIHI